MTARTIVSIAALALASAGFGDAVRETRVFVDGATVRDLRALGTAKAKPCEKWTDFISDGGRFSNRWLTDASVGPGNFQVKARLSVSHLTFCDASFRVGGGDRELIVNLQGVNGMFAILGPFVKADPDTGRVPAAKGLIKQDVPFDLCIERVGDQLSVSVNGKLMRRQWVSDGALGPVGIVPVRGRLHVERLEVTANFLPFEMGTALDVNSICKVRPCAPLKARPAGFPLGPFTNLKDGSVLTVVGREAWVSSDEGKTWAKYPMFRDPKFKAIPEHSAVCLASGTVVVNFINVGEQHYSWNIQTKRPNPDNRLPTYSVRSLDNGRTWEDPVLLADDYSGCMRSVIQLKDGTLVSMVQRLNYPEGRNYSQPYWSDDEGKTWHGADVMDCGGEHGDHSGLIEAALVELKDDRVWTLLRSYHGCFYEAFSSDSGRTWNPIPPRKSKIASTGSPGTIERMSDGSLLLVYNAIPTKGYERREELFASFSDDDGETWTKPVVIARCPGARVAYPYILERRPGELWISAMQGNLRATVALDELRAACGCGKAAAETAVNVPELSWTLPRTAKLEGNVLTFNVPPEQAGGANLATAKFDIRPYLGKELYLTMKIRARNLSKPSAHWLGPKFMLRFKDEFTGQMKYPGVRFRAGDLDGEYTLVAPLYGVDTDCGELCIGLQSASGEIAYDLSTLKVSVAQKLFPPKNVGYKVSYPERVAKRPALRGAMVHPDLTEKDVADLAAWGGNLMRYQFLPVRRQGKPAGKPTKAEAIAKFRRDVEERLDYLEKNVLGWARTHGMMVVVDMHMYSSVDTATMMDDDDLFGAYLDAWKTIAMRLRGNTDVVYGYDIVNEPRQEGPARYGYFGLQESIAREIRAIDPDTTIVMESNNADAPDAYSYMNALDMDNVVYQVHVYQPLGYTHQLVGPARRSRSAYPRAATKHEGAVDKEYLRKVLAPVLGFQREHGCRILVGEFSVAAWAEGGAQYLDDLISLFEEYGWDWTYHAFREATVWSVEHEASDSKHRCAAKTETDRKKVLCKWMGKNAALPDPAAEAKAWWTPEPTSAAAENIEAPTFENVKYGGHVRQGMDVWLPKDAKGPVPCVVYIHGGAWVNGARVDKYLRNEVLPFCRKEGFALATISYRMITSAGRAEGVIPPVKAPIDDAVAAVKCVIGHAAKWKIDPGRIGLAGGSAGACSSLIAAFSDDNALGVRAVFAYIPQTTLDPKELREWIPNGNYGAHAFGYTYSSFDKFLANRERHLEDIAKYSPAALVRRIAPEKAPVVIYKCGAQPKPGELAKDPTHAPQYCVRFEEICRARGIDCRAGGYDDFAQVLSKGGLATGAAVPFKLGVAGFTFNKRTIDDALAIMQKADVHYLCVKDFHLPFSATDAEIAAFKAKCASYGVTPYGIGPVYVKDAAKLREQFEFARRLGVRTIVGVPYEPTDTEDSWSKRRGSRALLLEVDKLVKEFDVRYAIHNHGPASPDMYPDVEYGWNLVKDLDPRIGFCIDVGWEYGSGKDPAETIRKYGARIYDAHIKNFPPVEKNGGAIPLPRGKIDLVPVFRAFAEVGYDGVCSLEYAKDYEDNLLAVVECIAYERGICDVIGGNAKK